MMDTNAVRDQMTAADTDFGAAVEDAVRTAILALDDFAVAERQHLGDFIAGRYADQATAARTALDDALAALETARQDADTARQAAYAAAIAAAG